MVLVRYLKHIEPKDGDMAERLKTSIKWTQEYLLDKRHFNLVSNHAMWEAMGLFETTRVWPDTAITRIALDRLHRAVNASVSEAGTHMEHSPSYHFWFLEWLNEYVIYLESLETLAFPGIGDMAQIDTRMKTATYYLYDHALRVPQVGDTDDMRFEHAPYPISASDKKTIWYDEPAGYAIYKDAPSSEIKRYIVFCNQSQPPLMRFHYHNDRMAVYYSYDGEIILGDAGRYSYTQSAIRSYVLSASAHNTILKEQHVMRRHNRADPVLDKWLTQFDGSDVFGAQLNNAVMRNVMIPPDKAEFEIRDVMSEPVPYLVLWHVGPDVQTFELTDSTVTDTLRSYQWTLVTKKNRWFRLRIDVEGGNTAQPKELELFEGQKAPYMGWYSPGYNTLIPVPTVQVRVHPVDTATVITRIVLVK
jgi:hypothetical protein